jgi:hypothetical protein
VVGRQMMIASLLSEGQVVLMLEGTPEEIAEALQRMKTFSDLDTVLGFMEDPSGKVEDD